MGHQGGIENTIFSVQNTFFYLQNRVFLESPILKSNGIEQMFLVFL